jgi:hypothetical protein
MADYNSIHTGETIDAAVSKPLVSGMVADTTLAVGDFVRTSGYTTAGDGGDNEYQIVVAGTGTDDGGSYIDLVTHQAKGLFPKGKVYFNQFGADADSSDSTNSVALQAAFNFSREVFSTGGEFIFTEPVSYPGDFGWRLSGTKGETRFVVDGDTHIITPPIDFEGQQGVIEYIEFDSTTPGVGTAIHAGGLGWYMSHIRVHSCNFIKNLKYGIYGAMVNCEIEDNHFGFPYGGEGVDFTPIVMAGYFTGPLGEHSANNNRITDNSFFNASGSYAVFVVSGYNNTFEGNSFEQNHSTVAALGFQDCDNVYILENWFEGNGDVPNVKFIQGATAETIVTVIQDNWFKNDVVAPSDTAIDITGLSNPRLTCDNNTFAAYTKVVREGGVYDNLSWFNSWSGNQVTGGSTINPNSDNRYWSRSGSGVIEGDLTVGGEFSAAKVKTSYTIVDVPTATATTVLTTNYVSTNIGVYLVSTVIQNQTSTHHASTIVYTDINGAFLVPITTPLGLTLSTSGDDVQVTQTSGQNQDISVTVLRLN